jgi:putative PIN family toxin of toxin-antitoxin system
VALDVTADSNIYISALVFAGRPLQFLDAARAGVFRLAISGPLLAEIHRVLRDKFRWPADDLAEAASDLADFTMRVHSTRTIDAVPEDPDDNRVLECAVAAGSSYIVTGEAALLRIAAFEGIRIMRRRLHGGYQPITAALSEPAAMLAWLKISPGW